MHDHMFSNSQLQLMFLIAVVSYALDIIVVYVSNTYGDSNFVVLLSDFFVTILAFIPGVFLYFIGAMYSGGPKAGPIMSILFFAVPFALKSLIFLTRLFGLV